MLSYREFMATTALSTLFVSFPSLGAEIRVLNQTNEPIDTAVIMSSQHAWPTIRRPGFTSYGGSEIRGVLLN